MAICLQNFPTIDIKQVLRLASNKLTCLPSEIECLSSLRELNVSKNQIAYLPYSLARLQSLRELNVSYNELTAIPSDLVGCSV
jgi:Leucine-rich repeat (LRR) protein